MANETLTPEQVDALLGKLSTDDAFRELFQKDIGAAFKQLPGSPSPPADLKPGCCLMPAKLMSAEKIAGARNAIAERFVGMDSFKPHMLEA
jgi:putative modified peptide